MFSLMNFHTRGDWGMFIGEMFIWGILTWCSWFLLQQLTSGWMFVWCRRRWKSVVETLYKRLFFCFYIDLCKICHFVFFHKSWHNLVWHRRFVNNTSIMFQAGKACLFVFLLKFFTFLCKFVCVTSCWLIAIVIKSVRIWLASAGWLAATIPPALLTTW